VRPSALLRRRDDIDGLASPGCDLRPSPAQRFLIRCSGVRAGGIAGQPGSRDICRPPEHPGETGDPLRACVAAMNFERFSRHTGHSPRAFAPTVPRATRISPEPPLPSPMCAAFGCQVCAVSGRVGLTRCARSVSYLRRTRVRITWRLPAGTRTSARGGGPLPERSGVPRRSPQTAPAGRRQKGVRVAKRCE